MSTTAPYEAYAPAAAQGPADSTDLAGTWRAAGWWRDETILHDLRRWARLRPDRPALVCYSGAEARTVSYAELARRVDRLAAGLLRLGVRRGDVVTLQLPNSWELVALCLASARIGAVAGPVVPTMRRREVEFMTRLTASPVYIAAAEVRGFSYAGMSAEVADAVPTLRHRVLLGGDGGHPGGALDFTRDLYAPEPDPELLASLDGLEAGPDDPAQIMFTSGTTGEPKGVVHSHNTLYAMNRAQADVLGLGGDEVTAMGSPTTHQAGFTWNFVMPMLLGATAVQVDRWDAQRMLHILQARRVTFFMGAPTFLSDLIDAQRRTPHDLSALRSFATGSAPIAPLLVEDADTVLGCRVYALWGMTENGCVTVTRPQQPPLRAAGSDGTAVPGMEVRIIGRDRRAVPAGEVGRLQVRGATQCLGYFRRQEVYDASVTADGWFDTGDLARDDGHGGIRIAGRVKDMIVRGAENIPVVEVEGALLRHPAVKDVAVVGYPDARLGERACAFLVTTGPALGVPELRDHLAGLGMARTYWPERVELLPALPRTPSGKVQKFALRELLHASAPSN
ncbi:MULTISPECIES: AMP-binding protein [unclassified Streptomyces]|uniref:AMP-binding protein n=1 Tax=unclassified Streptomyces TaxID=2593676 RepID=UPI0001C18E8C|nr:MULTISPECIES: AMP-binding protein [unclassified Streptomyces]AEN09651.1 AMP-dependent synthetase and ligase [Streptomyces sp. SirexAA-E]MYR70107.1 AMP-binding protein [Streptomyces sp. SID4939]MYT64490.1 AMP-binding protein [Streptomyces sp. SID8357]MYT87303.1 AMP-binding protein [Streptomyces sp. SID8360]MYW37134.1 AMP-binding protein [Streptomyces sp. SID1]